MAWVLLDLLLRPFFGIAVIGSLSLSCCHKLFSLPICLFVVWLVLLFIFLLVFISQCVSLLLLLLLLMMMMMMMMVTWVPVLLSPLPSPLSPLPLYITHPNVSFLNPFLFVPLLGIDSVTLYMEWYERGASLFVSRAHCVLYFVRASFYSNNWLADEETSLAMCIWYISMASTASTNTYPQCMIYIISLSLVVPGNSSH